jgi:hypothetical protein
MWVLAQLQANATPLSVGLSGMTGMSGATGMSGVSAMADGNIVTPAVCPAQLTNSSAW